MSWWTEADQAELEVALWELVYRLSFTEDLTTRHRMIEVFLDWREKRDLLSKAEHLRRRHIEKLLLQHEARVVR